jgi:hypothetical protein
MSNFDTFAIVTEGNTSTAPSIFIASTEDDLATITTAGYLNDKVPQIKENDVIYINYDDTSTFPLNPGEASTLGEFMVTYSAPDYSLTSVLTALGQAAAKDVTDNTKSYVASVDGAPASYTAGSILLAGDTNGSIGADSGYNVNNLQLYASVAITAAEWNGMYAAPKQLIAAPGANKLIVVDRMELVMTFVAAAYAAGGVVAAQWDSTANGAGQHATNTEAAADFFAAASSAFMFNGNSGNAATTDGGLVPLSANVNKGLYLSNKTGAFTTGDGTWVAKIHYRIIDTV